MKYKVLILFLSALILRLILIPVAHHGDLNNNISWGEELLTRGVNGFYGSSDANDWPYSAPNQPPLYLFLFAATTFIAQSLGVAIVWLNASIPLFPSSLVWFWEVHGMDIITKLPGILADLGIGLVIYQYFAKRKKDSQGFTLALVWLANPVTWYSSAIWGQTDTLINLIGLIAVNQLLQRKLVSFSIIFTLGFLFKGSLGIFIPILLIVIVKQKYSIKDYLWSVGAVVLVIIASSIWFHPSIDFPLWFYRLYATRILPGEIGYLTANAFNFWWLVDSGKVLDSVIYFGLSARLWGILITILGMSGVILAFVRGKIIPHRLYLSLAVVSLISFLFMTRIHERYLFPFFPFATLLLGFLPSTLYLYVIISTIHLLNLYHLFWAPSIPVIEELYQNPLFPITLSMLLIGAFVVYAFKGKRLNSDLNGV